MNWCVQVNKIAWLAQTESTINAPAKDSVYGKRDGVVNGLAIVHKDPRNNFRTTRGFKTGTVHQVQMLPRSAMFKPDQALESQKLGWSKLRPQPKISMDNNLVVTYFNNDD